MLEINNLSVNYGLHRVLEGVSLGVATGELVVILGANGAGKTTLLKAVGGLVRAREGSSVTIAGVGVLLVEQNAKRSLEIADRGYLLKNGQVVGRGAADALRKDETVQRAYLGL